MKTLHCSDAGFTCDAVVTAATTEEVLQQAASKAWAVCKEVSNSKGITMCFMQSNVFQKLNRRQGKNRCRGL